VAKKSLSRYLRALPVALFILCIPIFLVTSNLRLAVNEIRLYEYGFNKYAVSEKTGISEEELLDVARGLVFYIDTGEKSAALDIFNEREIVHLQDVRDLVYIHYRLQVAAFGYLIAFTLVGLLWQRKRFALPITRMLLGSSIFTITLLLVMGLVALVNFQWLFYTFHRLFFSGDSWILSGYLPRIFTEGFFSDAALFLIGAVVVEALVIGGIGGYFVLRQRRARG
jgi:integral membrane protein (TIGR01906 family)